MAHAKISSDAVTVRAIWRKDPAKLGPVLKPFADKPERLESLALCAICPFARWYVRKNKLNLYCKEFHTEFPAHGDEVVTQCDSFALQQF